VARGHATAHTFCRSAQVFHLAGSVLFRDDAAALLRARRSRPALAIKNRVMAVDVALSRPSVTFLAGERERLQLCDRLGIDRTVVPRRHYYRPHGSATPIVRYFPDVALVGADTANAPDTRLLLAYLDDGAFSTSSFRTWLRRHAPMLESTRLWRVLCACGSPCQAAAATRTFEELFGGDTATRRARRLADLREYCELQQLYDARCWDQLSTRRLGRFFALKETLAALGERLFAEWLRVGEPALREAADSGVEPASDRFDLLILDHSYAAFEPVRGLR
jgi:hypothetical protein